VSTLIEGAHAGAPLRSEAVKLTINGEPREVAAGTVLSLLEELGLHPQGTIVERNREIVDREAYRETHLSEGDVLELVRLVEGG
jgi:thiamine biosynthesis protein ThiS